MDEFSLIQQYFSDAKSRTTQVGVILGIGDDAAIIKPAEGEELLFTTDTLINGVHFPEGTVPGAIGHKALAVNLSDIAAMAGQARWFTLALSLPEPDSTWLKAFSDGLLTLAKQFGVSLVGGDTTQGPLSITLSVIGTVPEKMAIRRSTAKPGDAIFVTGQPGMAALGLAAINNEIILPDIEQSKCRNKLDYPQPRLLEGQLLRDYASSMIDISDGLASDLGHILKASGCSAAIDSESLKIWLPAASDLPGKTVIEAALYGGDDYELLFTIPASRVLKLKQFWRHSFPPLTQIGEITKGEGILLRDSDGNFMKVAARGYNHFNA
ncbi:MAG: thiamine-phosphate kinase [Gammaproteobacteria bacterium]|nr:MAG: thiamine-phosphate kinase [Gammaproteobacteria bacterium]